MISHTQNILERLSIIRQNIDYSGLYTPIKRIYTHKFIVYGDHIELTKYKRIRLSYKNPSRSFVRKDNPRTHRSIIRSRENLVRLVEGAKYQYRDNTPVFATLTYHRNEQDIPTAYDDFKYFIKKIRRKTGVKVQYVAVPEFQDRGAIHFHIIFFNLPFVPVHQFQSWWGHGTTNIQACKNLSATSKYLLKYFTKSSLSDPRLIGKRVILTSRGFDRPSTHYDEILFDNIQECCTMSVVDSSSYETFKRYKIRINMQQELIFVGHSKGTFEGSDYDNLMLSNGVRAFKVKNSTGKTSFPELIPEKSKVLVTFKITAGRKEIAQVEVTKIELITK